MKKKKQRLLVDGLQQLQGRLYLGLGLAGLHCGADDGDVLALGCHVVSVGDHAHVDVWRREERVQIAVHRIYWVSQLIY